MDGSAHMRLPAYTPRMTSSVQSLALGRKCRGLLLAASLLAGMGGGILSHGSAVEPNRVSLTVVEPSGEPLEGAIVWALPVSDQAMPATGSVATAIEQRGKAFIPAVTPVRVGTAVSFPNLDTVRHHVYSFSPAKVFSLKLYLGTPAEPVVFDKPGEVVLGCNIHDGMLAYVMALETPYFGKTGAEGQAVLSDLVPGDYELRAWHPKQKTAPLGQRVTIQASGRLSYRFIADIGRQTTAGT
jgi:plastocyanin